MSYTGSKSGIGRGTTISITVVSTVTPVGEVVTITPSGRQFATEDVTNLQSTAREFVGTLPDEGQFEVVTNRVAADAGQVAVEAAFETGALQTFTLTLPKSGTQTVSGDSYAYSGIVTNANNSAITFDKKISYTFTFKISGSPVKTAGS